MKSKSKKLMAVLVVLVMAFSLCTGALAAPATTGTATVSITYGNFSTDGTYVGGGFANTIFDIEDYELDLETLQDLWVDTAWIPETFYLPDGVSRPNGGDANVLDAIIATFLENEIEDITAGWDSYTIPNGGYISNVLPQSLTTNPTVIVTIDGVDYYKYSGTGWQIACTQWDSDLNDWVLKKIDTYATDIAVFDGMEIVFDVSPYEIYWPV